MVLSQVALLEVEILAYKICIFAKITDSFSYVLVIVEIWSIVYALDLRTEGRWFKAWSVAISCCFLRQATSPNTQSLFNQVFKSVPATCPCGKPCDGLASHPEGVAILSVALCYRNGVTLQWHFSQSPTVGTLYINYSLATCFQRSRNIMTMVRCA